MMSSWVAMLYLFHGWRQSQYGLQGELPNVSVLVVEPRLQVGVKLLLHDRLHSKESSAERQQPPTVNVLGATRGYKDTERCDTVPGREKHTGCTAHVQMP